MSIARVVESGLPLLYLNQVGGQDELVFDGASFVLNADGQMDDTYAEWDTFETIDAVRAALATHKDVECEITELGVSQRGTGGSRRAGEQAAAAAMLEYLKAKIK